ncbi:MAG: PilZ domain-containing protein [Deltaproteobacteria bacterium]|nr:PilZ domain-containing protein [Deltaproteobacteria bacterium]
MRERRKAKGAVPEERRRSDRRADDRVPVRIWVDEENGRELCMRRTADLSAGGMQLDLGLPRPVGSRMRLKFKLPDSDHRFDVVAEVVSGNWSQEKPITNVRFLSLTGDEQILIMRFLESSPRTTT